ncbi:MAG: hypothetical protein AB7V50_04845 [Vampirovibrionia bacterium]
MKKDNNENRPLTKHFHCHIPLDRIVKQAYANAIMVRNVQNKSEIILSSLDMMAQTNIINIQISKPHFAA